MILIRSLHTLYPIYILYSPSGPGIGDLIGYRAIMPTGPAAVFVDDIVMDFADFGRAHIFSQRTNRPELPRAMGLHV